MIEITPKEIESVGQSRYMATKGRIGILFIILFGGLAISLTVEAMTKNHLVSDLILLVFLLPIIKVIFDSFKAGKKFREEYEKEHFKPNYSKDNPYEGIPNSIAEGIVKDIKEKK